MKVLTLSTVFPNSEQPVHGLFVFERIRHAAEHAEVRVVAPVSWFRPERSVETSEVRDGLRIEHPKFFYVPGVLKMLDGLFLFLSILPGMYRLRRDFDFELIDAHFGFPEGVAAVLLGWWFRRPVMVTLRGSEHAFAEYRLRKAAIRWALTRATRVVAVSRPLGELASELGVPPERIEIIENGVDVSLFRPTSRSEARRAVGIGDEKEVMISVGHLVPLKGYHRMIQALYELRNDFPHLMLVLVGGSASTSGSYPQQLRDLVDELGLTSRVIFPGSVPPERVVQWLNAADVFVLCSDREGCPNVLLESMACGRPVVAPRVGAVEDMVPPDAGVLFDDPADAAALRRSLSQALTTRWDEQRIRRRAESRTWGNVAMRVLQQWQICIHGTAGHISQPIPAEHEPEDAHAVRR